MTARRPDAGDAAGSDAIRRVLVEALVPLLGGDDATKYYDVPASRRPAAGYYADALLPTFERIVAARVAAAVAERDALRRQVEAVRRLLDERIERLEEVAERWDVPGGSKRLALRARDKADGLLIACHWLAVESTEAGSHD